MDIANIACVWEQRKLGGIVEFYSGLTYSPDNISEHGVLVLRSSNIQNDKLSFSDNVYVENTCAVSESVKLGDIIVVVRNGSRSLIGKHAIIDFPISNTVIGAFMTGLRYQVPNFMNCLLSTERFNKEIEKNMGATINQITTGSFKKMQFYFSKDIKEQKRIGQFFEKLDKLITLHQRKLEQLEQLKNTLLSKMFPKSGTNIPEIRFSGFTDAWKQRQLGELTQINTGSGDLQDSVIDGKYPFFVRSEKIERSNRYIFDGEAILIPGEGKLGEIYHYIDGKFDYHQRVYKISNFSDSNTFGKFILFELNKNFKKHALKYTVKATVDSLRLPTLKKYQILVPSYYEQVKIGEYFFSINNYIAIHQRKLEQLKNLKQTLLNKMFI